MKNLLQLLAVVFLFMTWGLASCSDDKNDPDPDPDPNGGKSAVEFALPDFSDSYVYLVKDATSTLAEVCKEYIPTFSKEKQAIVVYPYDKEGKVDYTKGFVADNGGSIRWNGDGTYVYTAGNAAAVTKLYVDSCKIITSAEPLKTALVQADQLKDYDGNLYGIVKIGSQYWMAGNLKVTHFNDGSTLKTDLGEDEYGEVTSGAYAVYDPLTDFTYDPEFGQPVPEDLNTPEKIKSGYGLLYDWYAAGADKFAPDGWMLPAKADMEKMVAFLEAGVSGEESTAGGMMKEVGLVHWNEAEEWSEEAEEMVGTGVNYGATNVSGFSAVGAGSMSWGYCTGIKEKAQIWLSTDALDYDGEPVDGYKQYCKLANDSDKLEYVEWGSGKEDFNSVRLLRK